MSAGAPTPPRRFFRFFAALGSRHPRLVLLVATLVAVVAGAFAWNVPVSTSRTKLVSAADNALQARLELYQTRFGERDPLVMVLSGGDATARRHVADLLADRLEREPEFQGRLLYRVGATEMAEVALLFAPERLSDIGQRFGGSDGVGTVVTGGLPAWLAATERAVSAGLEGDPSFEGDDAATGATDLAHALRALDATLRGADPQSELAAFDPSMYPTGGVTLDERGYIVTPDHAHHLVAMFAALPGSEGYELAPLVGKVRAIRDALERGNVRAELTGLPAIATDELTSLGTGLRQSTIATGLGIVVLLALGFRSLRYVVIALVPLGVGTLMSVAFGRIAFGGLNLVTASFVSALMGLGIDFSSFVLARYSEGLRAGHTREQAVANALGKTGESILLAASTTVLAFGTAALMTSFTAYSQLGVLVATGLVWMVTATFFLEPALLALLDKGGRPAATEFIGLRRLPALVRSGRIAIPLVALALGIAGGIFGTGVGWNARHFDFLPEHTESVTGLSSIESEQSATPVVASFFAEGVEDARALATKLRSLGSVASVETATDILPELEPGRLATLRNGIDALGAMPDFRLLRQRSRSAQDVLRALARLVDALDEAAFSLRRAGRDAAGVAEAQAACRALDRTLRMLPDDGRDALAQLETRVADLLERAWTTAARVARRGHYVPADLPSVFRARFVSNDGLALAVFAVPAGNIWDENTAKRFFEEAGSADPTACGPALEIYEHQTDIHRSFLRASGVTTVLMLLGCLVVFRNIRDALLAVVPVLLGYALMTGFMALAHVDLNVANIVALPLLQGMGVDAGAHVVERARQSAAEHGGIARLDDIVRATGSAVLIAATTTIVGFAALMVADYRAMKSLGLIMTVGMSSNLLASLVVLPALLVLLRRAR